MTVKQAIEILEQATSQINASRQTHLAILQALAVLKEQIKDKE